jgi:putative Holliday junction resolvase
MMQYGYTRELDDFLAACPQGRLLGIDPGSQQIGIAISDSGRKIASPHCIILRKKWSKDLAQIIDLATQNSISGLVLGYPLNMDGSEGQRCQSVRQMAKNLHEAMHLPVLLADERLSSVAVNRMMIDEGDLSRARRKELVDKLAASYLLQTILDTIGHRH